MPYLQTEEIESPGEQIAPGANTVALPSVPVMVGTHFHSLDEKGRVIIPSKLRPALTEQFWMLLDNDNNIAIYNHQTGLDIFEHLERLTSEYPDDEEIAGVMKRTTSFAELITVEPSNWRVPISETLRHYSDLDKDVVTVGVLNHAVLWDRERWEIDQNSIDEDDERKEEDKAVRKMQAAILRAAASGVRARNERKEQQSELARKIAPASDGGGSSKRSRLSQLGR